jgi:hypothetical protein
MGTLGRYCEVIDSACRTLRDIGDAYAWFFYWKKPEMLQEHLRKPKQDLSTGVGGLGEMAFISGTASIHGAPIISHLTTSILRVGDVTLIDPDTLEAAALGELKTKEVKPGELSIHLEIVGTGKALGDRLSSGVAAESVRPDPLWQPFQRKLKRQVQEMTRALSSQSGDAQRQELTGSYYTEELAEIGKALRKRAKAFVQAGTNVLLVGLRNTARRTFWSRMQGGAPVCMKKMLDDLPNRTMGILDRDSSLNSLHYGILNGSYFAGGTPLWWWPVESEFLESIYLGKSIVVVLYNPAKLVERLMAAGFESDNPTARNPRFHMLLENGAKVELHNFPFWISATINHLATEDTVANAIKQTTQAIIDSRPAGNIRVDIAFNQYLIG